MAIDAKDGRLTANERRAVEFHEPFKTGDLDAIDEILHPRWVNHPRNPHEGPGPEGWKGTVGFLRSVFPDMEFVVEELIEAGDKVVVRSVGTGTQEGEFLGKEPTGKRVEFRALDVHRFEDGRIVESWHSEDIYGMLAQLGIIGNPYGAQLDPYPAWE